MQIERRRQTNRSQLFIKTNFAAVSLLLTAAALFYREKEEEEEVEKTRELFQLVTVSGRFGYVAFWGKM